MYFTEFQSMVISLLMRHEPARFPAHVPGKAQRHILIDTGRRLTRRIASQMAV